jgi:hypothetical protein
MKHAPTSEKQFFPQARQYRPFALSAVPGGPNVGLVQQVPGRRKTMSDKGIEHWLDRIGRMTTVRLSVEGELQEALWYAHHAGADLPTLARAAERTEEQVAEAIAEVDPAELGDPDEPAVEWLYSRGGAIYA